MSMTEILLFGGYVEIAEENSTQHVAFQNLQYRGSSQGN